MTANHEVRCTTTAAPDAVFAVLADGWRYASWVVGASRVRGVDTSWPQPGSRIRHSFGIWPLVLDDVSQVQASESPRHLVITAQGWPVGAARVELRIDAWDRGSIITMSEDAVAGPGRLIPKPLRQLVIAARNREALRRLALLAEGDAAGTGDSAGAGEGAGGGSTGAR